MRINSASIISAFLIGIFMTFIFLYNHFLERLSYIVVERGYSLHSILVLPIFYWIILLIYGLIYSKIFKQNIKKILVSIFSMGIGIHLVYLLFDLKVGLDKYNIFGKYGGIYYLYANIYFFAIICSFFIITTIIIYKIFTTRNGFLLKIKDKAILEHLIFFSPLLILSLYIICNFIKLKQFIGILFIIISCISALWFEISEGFKNKINKLKEKIILTFSNEAIALFFIFTIAFVIRFIWGLRLLSITGNNYIIASDDGLTYDPFGALIARGGTSEIGWEALHWGGMGYWYFLGLIYKIFGLHNFRALIFCQSLLGAIVPLCTYYIAKKIFNRVVGLLAALVVSFEMGLIFISGVIGMETLFVPMVLISMAFLIYTLATGFFKKKMLIFFVGFMFGLTNMARGEVLFFPFVLIFLLFLYALFSKKLTFKQTSIIAFCMLLGLFLGLSIHAVRNYVYLKKFTISTQQGAITFYQGGYENETLNKMGFNPFISFSSSLRSFIEHPFTILKLLFTGFSKNIFVYIFIRNFGEFDPFTIANVSHFRKFKYPAYILIYVCVFTVFGIAYAFLKRNKILLKSIILSYILYTISLYSFIAPKNPRHRAVLIPFFAIFFVYGIVVCIKKFWSEKTQEDYEKNKSY